MMQKRFWKDDELLGFELIVVVAMLVLIFYRNLSCLFPHKIELTVFFVFFFLCNVQFIDVGTMVSPTVFARRCLCYLMNDMPQEALNDAVQAQVISPIWHIASYLQAVALSALGRENESEIALKEGSVLEEKKNKTA